jgi:hypothetical protein
VQKKQNNIFFTINTKNVPNSCAKRAQKPVKRAQNPSNGRKNHQTAANSNSCQGIPTMGRARKPTRANFVHFFLKRAEIQVGQIFLPL